MTTLTFGKVRVPPTAPVKGGAVVRSAVDRIAAAWRAWQAERALASLGDEALHDIGLDRGSIARAVRTGERS